MRKLIQSAERVHLEAYFARVNWRAHLVPVVVAEIQNFLSDLKPLGLKNPYWSIVRDDANKGYYDNQKSEIWTDSITISLGFRPIRVNAVVPVKGRFRTLSESQASLAISQHVSGYVIAMIYPPSSDLAMPLKPFYVVDSWQNPGTVQPRQIRKLLGIMMEVDIFCGAEIYPNKKGTRLLTMLQAKDEILANASRSYRWTQTFHWVGLPS